jgi:3-oxoacyl-[acyl-carrier protein] reductase
MDYGIAGKRALVLGASRGLGAAIAKTLAAEGVTVLAAARNIDGIKGQAGLTPIVLDLADTASVQKLIDTVLADGGVDILVNNSGGPKPGPAQGQTTADWLAYFQSMATSLFAITDAMLPAMIDKQWGRIITVGSSGVVQPIPNLALSNGVRGAIAGWSKTLAGEVAKHGVTVNMVLPGRIDTDRVRQLDQGRAERSGVSIDDVKEASRAEIPAGRYGRPEEFAAAVAFLASQQAGYITGTMLPIDGGLVRGL